MTMGAFVREELREAGIKPYAEANDYLDQVFVPDFNRRFTVEPAEQGSAFLPLPSVPMTVRHFPSAEIV